MTVKFGIKTWTMLSSLVLALVFVTGCNSEETPPETRRRQPGAAAVPAAKPATEAKPATPPAPKPRTRRSEDQIESRQARAE